MPAGEDCICLVVNERRLVAQTAVAHDIIRHAALPGISLSGWALGWLLSGAVVVPGSLPADLDFSLPAAG